MARTHLYFFKIRLVFNSFLFLALEAPQRPCTLINLTTRLICRTPLEYLSLSYKDRDRLYRLYSIFALSHIHKDNCKAKLSTIINDTEHNACMNVLVFCTYYIVCINHSHLDVDPGVGLVRDRKWWVSKWDLACYICRWCHRKAMCVCVE